MSNLYVRMPGTRRSGSTALFKPQVLLHRILSMRKATWTGAKSTEIEFYMTEPDNPTPTDPDSFNSYLSTVPLGRSSRATATRDTPYDIRFDKKQPIVLLELDQNLNWEFTPGGFGVTTKSDYADDNFGLTHMYPRPDGKNVLDINDPVRSGGGCRALFFNVYRRGAYQRQSFNIHVTFYHPFSNGERKELVTIFDPDIKNDGGSFP